MKDSVNEKKQDLMSRYRPLGLKAVIAATTVKPSGPKHDDTKPPLYPSAFDRFDASK
ncbi:hypothetical protein [Rhizobium leguminosarum]|uniref:hypothetical protein n=1 Tax=Rhizobium leguminosarum TaxID=384 RepID=UPI00035D5531|nr:hypothetical protein [Rhizobium leguminosarum]